MMMMMMMRSCFKPVLVFSTVCLLFASTHGFALSSGKLGISLGLNEYPICAQYGVGLNWNISRYFRLNAGVGYSNGLTRFGPEIRGHFVPYRFSPFLGAGISGYSFAGYFGYNYYITGGLDYSAGFFNINSGIAYGPGGGCGSVTFLGSFAPFAGIGFYW